MGYLDAITYDIKSTKIDLSFVSEREGGQELVGFVPQSGRSGVTIASGLDLGQHNAGDLQRYGIPTGLIQKLSPYFGHIRDQADLFLHKNPLEVSKQEADLIDQKVFGYFAKWLCYNYDFSTHRKQPPATITKFYNLPDGVQTAVFDMVYNLGCAVNKFPRAWLFFQRNWWDKLYEELRNFGHKEHGLTNRREAEAELVKPYIDESVKRDRPYH